METLNNITSINTKLYTAVFTNEFISFAYFNPKINLHRYYERLEKELPWKIENEKHEAIRDRADKNERRAPGSVTKEMLYAEIMFRINGQQMFAANDGETSNSLSLIWLLNVHNKVNAEIARNALNKENLSLDKKMEIANVFSNVYQITSKLN